jgi:hypothetical protein
MKLHLPGAVSTNGKRLITLTTIFMILLLPFSRTFALPVAIDACITANTCIDGGISSTFTIDGNLVIAHDLFDFRNNSNTPEQKVLVEYQLGAGSRIDDTGGIAGGGPFPLQTSAITGSLWLEINKNYNLANAVHALTLHFDQSSPPNVPGNAWGDTFFTNENTQTLLITTAGLLNGSGENLATCCTDQSPFPSTNLFDSQGNDPFVCVAEGCFANAKLNLLGLTFTPSGTLNFNPSETRSLLYFEAAGFEGFINNTYTMSAVPVPAAVWLFGSGIGIILGFTRRNCG